MPKASRINYTILFLFFSFILFHFLHLKALKHYNRICLNFFYLLDIPDHNLNFHASWTFTFVAYNRELGLFLYQGVPFTVQEQIRTVPKKCILVLKNPTPFVNTHLFNTNLAFKEQLESLLKIYFSTAAYYFWSHY